MIIRTAALIGFLNPKFFIGFFVGIICGLCLLMYNNSGGHSGISTYTHILENKLSEIISNHDQNVEDAATPSFTPQHNDNFNYKIFCWVLTMPKSHDSKAKAVKNTWLKRCDNYIFTSTEVDPDLGAIDLKLGFNESRTYLWGKYKLSMQYLYDHFVDDYDFFIKADDDTYFIMENAIYMIGDAKPTENKIWGRRFKLFAKDGYVSGGSGYVFTREVLKQFVLNGIHKGKRENNENGVCHDGLKGSGDVNFGVCMNRLNATFVDTRDSKGKELFYPLSLLGHSNPNMPKTWLDDYNFYPLTKGIENMSEIAVSFHYVIPSEMYALEYVIYHLRLAAEQHFSDDDYSEIREMELNSDDADEDDEEEKDISNRKK